MKPEDLMNVPMEKQDLSGCAHRKQTKEEGLANALASVNANPPKMTTFKINTFDGLKREILSKYPPVKSLPFLHRIKAFFAPDYHETWITEKNEMGSFTQKAVLVIVNGKEYTRRFGSLH